jgi:hypothetical protein
VCRVNGALKLRRDGVGGSGATMRCARRLGLLQGCAGGRVPRLEKRHLARGTGARGGVEVLRCFVTGKHLARDGDAAATGDEAQEYLAGAARRALKQVPVAGYYRDLGVVLAVFARVAFEGARQDEVSFRAGWGTHKHRVRERVVMVRGVKKNHMRRSKSLVCLEDGPLVLAKKNQAKCYLKRRQGQNERTYTSLNTSSAVPRHPLGGTVWLVA